MPLSEAAAQEKKQTASEAVHWWRRYTRWRPTSLVEADNAEKVLLAMCSSVTEVSDVSLGEGKQQFMHTIIAGDASNPPLVCLPGYGAGAGFYFRNIDGLAKQFRVHLVDLLGTGMSGRPAWQAKGREQAEDFFLDALSAWHKELGLGKMILLGHSLGGYLAATYALRHPEDVEHLILVCPAGLVKPPENVTPTWAHDFWTWRGQFYRFGRRMWNSGYTPGSLVRGLGPWGPGLVQGYTTNRFREGKRLSSEETEAFGKYFYHITAQRGSGEFALSQLLGPMAWARHPLEGRMHQLQVPCSLIYGETDWMKPEAGKRIMEDVNRDRGKLTSSDLQWDIIGKAGHYPFLDQPDVFLQRLLKQTKEYLLQRGQDAARKFDRGYQEASAEAAAALEAQAAVKSRNLDL